MLKTLIKLLTVIPAISGLLMDCLQPPVSGTETGNPGMVACAKAAFEPLDSMDQWLPSHYLVNGVSQLNPGFLNDGTAPLPLLAKRTASDTVNVTVNPDSFIVIYRVDTVITVDTVFFSDTLVQTVTRTDTLAGKGSAPQDSSFIISEHLYSDSILLFDTVVVFDTLLVNRLDTIRSDMTDTSYNISVPVRAAFISASYSAGTVYYDISYDNQLKTKIIADNPSIEYRYDSTLVWVSRNSFISGVNVYEEYRDSDQDGLLYLCKSAASPGSRLLATWSKADSRTELHVNFDAGSDKVFPSINDNRIISLKRTSVRNLSTLEEVLYGNEYASSSQDSVSLTVNRNSGINTTLTRYSCLRGTDAENHLENRLAAVFFTRSFGSGPILQIRIEITPDVPLSAGSSPSTAAMEAFINYGKGQTGEFHGTIDFLNGQVSGIYAEGGQEYNISYSRESGSLDQNRIE